MHLDQINKCGLSVQAENISESIKFKDVLGSERGIKLRQLLINQLHTALAPSSQLT